MTVHAVSWRNGVIQIGQGVPDGTLPLIYGPEKSVRALICARARHAYDGKTLLVPGIPEADDEDVAVAPYQRFKADLDKDWLPGRGRRRVQRRAA